MTEIQKELDQAWRMLSGIPVSGDGVDLMAEARERLRQAYQLAEETEEVEERGG